MVASGICPSCSDILYWVASSEEENGSWPIKETHLITEDPSTDRYKASRSLEENTKTPFAVS